jgi:hypothetical protein
MADDKKYRKIVTPEFRVSFAYVFVPQSGFDNQTPKYSLVMLIPKKTDITELKKLLQDAAKSKWGDKIPKGIRNPIRDGNEKELDGYKDMWAISASSKIKPGIVGPDMQPIISTDEFYSGCYARASVTAFAYDQKGNKGVAFGLQNIQKLKDGEPFSGRTRPEEDFDATSDSPKEDSEELFG